MDDYHRRFTQDLNITDFQDAVLDDLNQKHGVDRYTVVNDEYLIATLDDGSGVRVDRDGDTYTLSTGS